MKPPDVWPFWLSCGNPWWSPWCWIDDTLHKWFPWTFCGHWAERLDQTVYPWICRKHDSAAEKWNAKHYPEFFEEN